MDAEKIEHIKRVEHLKSQCKRYGVTYTDVANRSGFNVNSFQTAMQNYSISSDRVDTAFGSLKELVYEKGLEYNVRKNGFNPESKLATQ